MLFFIRFFLFLLSLVGLVHNKERLQGYLMGRMLRITTHKAGDDKALEDCIVGANLDLLVAASAKEQTGAVLALLVQTFSLDADMSIADTALIVTEVTRMEALAWDGAFLRVEHDMSGEKLGVGDLGAVRLCVHCGSGFLVGGLLLLLLVGALALVLCFAILDIDHGTRTTTLFVFASTLLVNLLDAVVGLEFGGVAVSHRSSFDVGKGIARKFGSRKESNDAFTLLPLLIRLLLLDGKGREAST